MSTTNRRMIGAALVGGAAALFSSKAQAQPQGSSGVRLGSTSATALAGNLGGIDDPTNASGLSSPAIVRGTVYGHLATGVTVGAGQVQATQTATLTGLQNAINYAVTNNKYFELIPGVYEIYGSAGLSIPYDAAFTWRGSEGATQINQFYVASTGAPILTIGDTSNTHFSQQIDIEGVYLNYGAAVTGLTSANALCIGACGWSRFSKIQVGTPQATTPLNPAYRGVYIYAGGSGQSFFSNSVKDIVVNGAQLELLNWTQAGTGNVADNIYLQGGAGANAWPAVTLPLNMNMVQNTTENDIRELNIEWLSTNKAMDIENCFGLKIGHLHMEGIKLTGANPTMALVASNALTIDQWTFVDPLIQSANLTGTPTIVSAYQPGNDSMIVNQLVTVFNNTGEINTGVAFWNLNSPGAGVSQFTMRGAKLPDAAGGNLAGHFSFDAHMPVSASQFLPPATMGEYRWGIAGSRLTAATLNVSAAYTHYGQLVDAVIILAATGTYTVTLADTIGATGTQKPLTGNTVTITRPVYTSGTVTISDATAGSITTNTSTATVTCQFNGTAWVTVTPVT